MKCIAAISTVVMMAISPYASAADVSISPISEPMHDKIQRVAPALERYANEYLKDLWRRDGLSPRDRSIVTVAALIARGDTVELPYQIAIALDNGVKPAEISEAITHLAFYSGWGNAMSAVTITKDVFAERNIEGTQLPEARSTNPLPLDKDAEAARKRLVQDNYGATSPGTVQYTTDVLFLDLWLRPDLAPRDRSLVTVSALIASGQVEQVSFHLGKAMDNGLTREEAGEMITQLAFYAGWPRTFSALPVAKGVFEKRGKQQ